MPASASRLGLPKQIDSVEPSESTLGLRKARALVTQGPDQGRSIEIGLRRVIVGRAPSSDMVLSDPTINPMHVELELDPAGVFVRKLAANSEIQAAKVRIEEGVVEIGTSLILGQTILRLDSVEQFVEFPCSTEGRMGDLVGTCLKMRLLFGLLKKVAISDDPLLIEGETGTGKELAARAVHDHSHQAQEPYEVLDCRALPVELLEAELFGTTKSSGDALAARPGIFERAANGTVVLDEIGELPAELQSALLAVLANGQVRRIGEQTPRSVSARVIATTNRVLARQVAEGSFREDLYACLRRLHVILPPLRHRKEDLPLLVDHFLGPRHGFPPSWLRVLNDYDWPGNVRELRNALLRAQAHARRHGPNVPLGLLLSDEPFVEELEVARSRFEREYLQVLLARAKNNITHAARLAGMTRQGLYRILRKHGLRTPQTEEEHSIMPEEPR